MVKQVVKFQLCAAVRQAPLPPEHYLLCSCCSASCTRVQQRGVSRGTLLKKPLGAGAESAFLLSVRMAALVAAAVYTPADEDDSLPTLASEASGAGRASTPLRVSRTNTPQRARPSPAIYVAPSAAAISIPSKRSKRQQRRWENGAFEFRSSSKQPSFT
jgi:hypothetical protein